MYKEEHALHFRNVLVRNSQIHVPWSKKEATNFVFSTDLHCYSATGTMQYISKQD